MAEEQTAVMARARKTGRGWDEPLEEDLLFRTLQRLESDPGWEERPAALAWLRRQAGEIALNDRMRSVALRSLCRMAAKDDLDSSEIVREIWSGGWEDRPQEMMSHLLHVMKRESTFLRRSASEWLGRNANRIARHPHLMMKALEALLKILDDQSDENQSIRESAVESMELIWVAAWQAGEIPWNAIHDIWERIWVNGGKYQRQRILTQVETALQIEDGIARQAAADLLLERAGEIAGDARVVDWAAAGLMKILQETGDQNLRRSAMKAVQRIWEASWTYRPQKVIERAEDALKSGGWATRRAALRWVKDSAAEIARDEEYLQRLQIAMLEMGNGDEVRPPEVNRIAREALTALWEVGWALKDNREPRRFMVLEQVLAALRDGQDIELQKAAADWVGEKAREIAEGENAYRRYKRAADTLVACRAYYQKAARLDGPAGASRHRSDMQHMLERVDIALRGLWEALAQTQYKRQREVLLDPDADQDKKTSAIWRLADRNTLGSREALRFLVGEWIRWLRQYKEPHLVELTAEVIRYNHYAVLALIGYFGNPGASNLYQTPERAGKRNGDGHDLAGGEADDQPSEAGHPLESSLEALEAEHLREHVNEWIQKGRKLEGLLGEAELEEAEAFLRRDPDAGAQFRRDLEHLVIDSRSALEKEKLLMVDLRIAKQLADMSDPTFFEDLEDETLNRIRKEEYHLILQELKKHAVPVVLGRMSLEEENEKLPNEIKEIKNETRAHIVRMLGYTGGREAVDALARQVVGKEKQRKDRQELLDEYYLKPSLKRGEEAADILNATILESKRTLLILQALNSLVFLIGLALLVIGLYVSMQASSSASRVAGALASLGGFAGMIALLVRAPLDQIQNAMARLVHVETAFTSFIWQLNLYGTFIQSRYVKNGRLKDSEIQFTVEEIEKSMETTMSLVSIHTLEEEPRMVTRLNRLEPAGGEAGKDITITLYGQNLLGDSQHKKERAGMIAINHVPLRQSGFRWTEREVAFQLPGEMSASAPGDTAWISLFVDGMETNALPFHMIRKGV